METKERMKEYKSEILKELAKLTNSKDRVVRAMTYMLEQAEKLQDEYFDDLDDVNCLPYLVGQAFNKTRTLDEKNAESFSIYESIRLREKESYLKTL